jgi:adenylate cyclase
LISSKELLERTGISRATLNNYVQLGILSRPDSSVLEDSSPKPGKAMGYFPDNSVERIELVQELKTYGQSVSEIAHILNQSDWVSRVDALRSSQSDVLVKVARRSAGNSSAAFAHSPNSLRLSLDTLTYPAYMLNYNMELTWVNESAKLTLLPASIPSNSAGRNIFSLMAHPEAGHTISNQRALALLHLKLASARVNKDALAKIVVNAEPDLLPLLSQMTGGLSQFASVANEHLQLDANPADKGGRLVSAVYFREGVLIIHSPAGSQNDELIDFLSRRDQVIQDLLKNRLPVMTQLAVLVADVQNSVQICSELPPEEYFQLINQIWATLAPVLRKYYGTSGKHAGDGVVHYFFPHPESNYLFNAIACAHEMRQVMKTLSKEWQIKKDWSRELYLNIGIHEGQEWLGTFQAANHIEFAVLGDTINYASRVSDLARQGAIWATKSLVSKLTMAERERLQFGVHRENEDGRDRFIESSYAQVQSLVDLNQGKYEKLKDIANLAITEIRRVEQARSQGF